MKFSFILIAMIGNDVNFHVPSDSLKLYFSVLLGFVTALPANEEAPVGAEKNEVSTDLTSRVTPTF